MSAELTGPHSQAFPGLFLLDALSEEANQAMDAFLRTAAAEDDSDER